MPAYSRRGGEIGRYVAAPSDRLEWRSRRPWPPGMRFRDGRTERIILQEMPPKPASNAYGSAGAMCVDGRFAEPEE